MEPAIREHLQEVSNGLRNLPMWVYQQIRDLSVADLVADAPNGKSRSRTKSVEPKQAPSEEGVSKHTPSPPQMTQDLDARVEHIVVHAGESIAITEIETALRSKLGDVQFDALKYNTQKIRRSLVRLQEQGHITSEGKTKSKRYLAVEKRPAAATAEPSKKAKKSKKAPKRPAKKRSK